MGNYNPHQPYILGEEWVPIRDEQLVYSPNVNAVELGTAFTLTTARQVRTARFYVNEVQPTTQAFQTALVNIYPNGLEDQTGPIREVIIPVTSVQATGSNISTAGGAASNEAALAISGDGTAIEFDYNATTPQDVAFWFGVSAYPELANKRILNVSLIYTGRVNDLDVAQLPVTFVDPDPSTLLTNVRQRNDIVTTGVAFTPPTFFANTGVLTLATSVDNSTLSSASAQTIEALSIGDINNFYEATPGIVTSRQPWRYADLLKFEQSYPNASRQHIFLRVQLPTTAVSVINPAYPQLLLDYLAMRVIYCEEKRVAYGAQRFGYAYGMNQVALYDLNLNADPVLPVGQYLPTLSWVNPGQVDYGQAANGDFPQLNALRELYQTPSHPGVQVNVPFPLAERLGDTFVSEVTHILPQLSLHASGGTLTEPHVYGRQVAAQVYGVNTATQDIYDDITGAAASYPQVRYYARRFGETTIPLTLTGVGTLTGSTAAITVASFDALTEILDGWKEVTLRFTGAPSMGAVTGNPGWTWSAFGETSGNRWEVLGAAAPAVSGIPGNLYNLVPTADRLGTATYQPPAGDTVELTWMPHGVATPWVTGSTIDANTDAVLIFSQDPATVTGLSLSQLTQSVSGIGALCGGGVPCCIPTGIGYHQVSWGLPPNSGVASDDFNRTVAAGSWGAATVGGTYALRSLAADYSVAGLRGLMTPTVIGSRRDATLSVGAVNFDIRVKAGMTTVVAAGSTADFGLIARRTDDSNYYRLNIRAVPTTQAATLSIQRQLAGVSTTLASTTGNPATVGPGGMMNMRFLGDGSLLKAKIWPVGQDEPAAWDLETTDTSLTTGGGAGMHSLSGTAVGNGFHFTDFSVTPPAYWFGGYELQRWDSVTGGDFATIMLATDASQSSFRDYEARVGVTAVYRIRMLNVLNFAGSWSTYVSGAPPAPGVTGGCGSQDGVLIFTSNSDQTGADNAAYVMQWDNTPSESFDLPEADMVTFQPMYGRDGSIAFHGTERGLEEFSRQVLLAAGAIALPSLADASDIRDLAWAQLPYVCVRDDRGNRWFSNVRVNGVNARNNAQSYMASLAVTETTRTPYPVDP